MVEKKENKYFSPENVIFDNFNEAVQEIKEFHQKHPKSKKRFTVDTLYHIKKLIIPNHVVKTLDELDKKLDELNFSKADKIALCYEYLNKIESNLSCTVDSIVMEILNKK